MSLKRPATDEAERLTEEALKLLRQGEVERAVWRLVDAVGLIRSTCFISPSTMGFRNNPTGRGFYLGEKE
jgi:hypothetical protein